jgi:nitrite reductase/ring-hydroxylating ferredoxin subunit
MQSRIQLCRITDVANGASMRVQAGGLALAIFKVNGQVYVTDDACTHGPGSLSEGYLDGEIIECNFHGGRFNVRTGEVMSPPCMVPLRTYAVTVAQGMVLIDAPET